MQVGSGALHGWGKWGMRLAKGERGVMEMGSGALAELPHVDWDLREIGSKWGAGRLACGEWGVARMGQLGNAARRGGAGRHANWERDMRQKEKKRLREQRKHCKHTVQRKKGRPILRATATWLKRLLAPPALGGSSAHAQPHRWRPSQASPS